MFRFMSIAMLAMCAAPALADELSYNYIDLGYQAVEIDLGGGFDVDGDGFAIGGSFEGGESWHIFAGYGSTNFDFGVDLNELAIGAGYHTPISDTVDFVGELAYVTVEVEVPAGFSTDEDGIGASIGLRGMMSDVVELSGSIDYVDLGGDGETSFDANAWFNMSPAFALGINAGFGDDVTTYGVGVRWYFSN